jgi:hypothetical protein
MKRNKSPYNKWYWYLYGKKVEPDLYISPYTKINSRWCTDINVNRKKIKFLEDNMGDYLMTSR